MRERKHTAEDLPLPRIGWSLLWQVVILVIAIAVTYTRFEARVEDLEARLNETRERVDALRDTRIQIAEIRVLVESVDSRTRRIEAQLDRRQ